MNTVSVPVVIMVVTVTGADGVTKQEQALLTLLAGYEAGSQVG